MDEVTIRPADSGDTERVLLLWAKARSPAAVAPDDPDVLGRLIDHPGSVLLVAEHAGEIVGSLIAAWDGWRGNMYRLAVLEPYRRQGIATRLVELAHARLLAAGARRVTALVAYDESEAAGLWLSMGYTHDELMARFVRNLTP